MKRIIIAMAAIAAAFTVASCDKEQIVEPEENPTVGKSVITASIENDATKTALTPDEEGYKVVWTAGDQLFVGDDQGTDWCAKYTLDNASADSSKGVFSWQKGDFFYTDQKEKYTEPLFEVDNTYIAMYPSDLYELDDEGAPAYGITWKTEQTYSWTDRYIPMYGAAECTNEGVIDFKFNNLGGILRLTVKGSASIKSIRIEANEILSGPIARIDGEGVERNEFIACLEAVSENNKKYIDLNCGDGAQLSSDGTDFYISMPCKFSYDEEDNIVFDGYSDVTITLTDTEGRTCVKKLKNGKGLVIERSKITTASFTASEFMANIFDVAPTGKFTVANDRQVYFAQGNLVCDISGETPKWGFYQNQYGYATGYSSTLISLFTWGYDPEVSMDPGTSINNTINNLKGNYLPQDKDWGSQIGDGKTWRTLTGEEWKYLFENRENAEYKYGYATVGGVHGLIILPDSFTDPMKNGGSREFVPTSTTGWNANVYTTGGNWEAMEAAGAVFLPAAGNRSKDSLSYVGDYGYYWSSSHPTGSGPYGLTFYNSLVDPDATGDASTGKSVRLVKDAYTVTFDMNGKAGTAPESLKGIPHGSRITWPSGPTADGYTFKGWYKNMACTDKWNFETDEVTANTTLYARWIEGALSGKFTINSDGKQIYFSAGNLTYNKTNDKWAFYENQTDYANSYYDPLVSQYTWGYGTWSTEQNTGAYIDGPDFVDWGIKIGDGKTWYTLSIEEWSYLVGTRTVKGKTGYGNTCVMATIHGVYGLVIFYDGYEGETTGLTAIPNGCAFLPAAGVRYVTYSYINRVGSQGEYWSRSSCTDLNAYGFLFDKTGFWTSNNNDKRQPRSVRLVTDVVEQ